MCMMSANLYIATQIGEGDGECVLCFVVLSQVLVKEVESVYGECVLGGAAVAYLAALLPPRRDTILRRVVSILRATAIVTPKQYE